MREGPFPFLSVRDRLKGQQSCAVVYSEKYQSAYGRPRSGKFTIPVFH